MQNETNAAQIVEPIGAAVARRESAAASKSDLINSPDRYRGASGMQSIEITEAYRLGPHLTQAFDYIVRAGRKTPDPRQDLRKAVYYLRRAVSQRVELRFGFPRDERRPTPQQVSADFGLDVPRSLAVGCILHSWPCHTDIAQAADILDALLVQMDEADFAGASERRDPAVETLRDQLARGKISSLQYARDMALLRQHQPGNLVDAIESEVV